MRDHISFMTSARWKGLQLSCDVLTMFDQGMSINEIVSKYDTTSEIVTKILKAAKKI